MPTIFERLKRNADQSYGPTKKNHYYKCVHYHGKGAAYNPHKSTWCIKEYEEYGVFKLADENDWLCPEKDALFSIVDQGQAVLGSNGERLGMFPKPANGIDAWHGFPVKSESHRPSSELLDKWESKNLILYVIRIRIERGSL